MGWRERLGAGRPFQLRTKVSVERGVQGHFIKEIQDLTIDWVEKDINRSQDGSDILWPGEQKNINTINRNRIVRNNSYLGLHERPGSG